MRKHVRWKQIGFLLVLVACYVGLHMVLDSKYSIKVRGITLNGTELCSEEYSPVELRPCTAITRFDCHRFINSRKYQVDCMNVPSKLYPLLITGLGGTGTHSVAEMLCRGGLKLPHEVLGTDGSVSWFYAVNDVLLGTEYPHHSKLLKRSFLSPRFETVLHLMRCPMQQISSFTSHLNASYDFVRVHILEQIKSTPNSSAGAALMTSDYHKGMKSLDLIEDAAACTGEQCEQSLWVARNHADFFQRRKSLVAHSGKGCPRGGKCWLHFAALSWLFWNSHIQRYSDSTYRIETDLGNLVSDTSILITKSRSNSSKKERVLAQEIGESNSPLFSQFWTRKKSRISSVKHKIHGNYSLNDVSVLDPELATEIAILARCFGYDISGDDWDPGGLSLQFNCSPFLGKHAGRLLKCYTCP